MQLRERGEGRWEVGEGIVADTQLLQVGQEMEGGREGGEKVVIQVQQR